MRMRIVSDTSYAPDADFAAAANGKQELFDRADADFEGFWADQARERLTELTPDLLRAFRARRPRASLLTRLLRRPA